MSKLKSLPPTKKMLKKVIAFFTIAFLSSLTITAANINFNSRYGNNGDVAGKIQRAINEASNGDVIIFNSSYYDLGGTELITINKPITLQGANPNGFNANFFGASGIQTTLGNTATIAIRSNNVRFRNISIVRKNQGEGVFDILIDARHTTYLADNPIAVNQQTYNGISLNNVVLDGGAYCFHSGNGVGIAMNNVSMVNWRRTGFWANRFGRSNATPKMEFDHCLIDTDDIVGFDDRAFSFDAGNNEYPVIWDFNNTTIKDTRIENSGIALSRCENVTIEGCTFFDNEGAIDILHIEEFSNNVRVNGNVFDCQVVDPNRRSRIVQLDRELQITSDVEFTNNRIVGNYNFFISAYAPNNITITGNDFTAASAANPNSINLAFYESRDREPIDNEFVSNDITIRNNPGLGNAANNGFTGHFPINNARFTVQGYTNAQKNISRFNPPPAVIANGTYEIVSRANGNKLAANSSGFGVIATSTSNANSQWRVTFRPPYSYHLQNVGTGRYLETHLGYTEFDIINNQPQNISPFLNNVPNGAAKPFWAILNVGNSNFEIFPGGNERQSALSVNGSAPKFIFTISIDNQGRRTNVPLTDAVRWMIRPVGATTTPPPTTTPSNGSAPIGSVISLRKSGGDRRFVSAVAELGNDLYANQPQAFGNRQYFRVEAHSSGNGIALKNLSSNKYIRIIGTNNAGAIVDALGGTGGWTRFEWRSLGGNRVAFKSLANNLWLQAPHNADFTPLFIRGAEARSWETFEYQVISNISSANKLEEATDLEFENIEFDFNISPTVAQSGDVVEITTQGKSSSNANDIKIFNVNGQLLINTKLTGTSTQVNTNKLTSGIYLVRVNNEKSKKLIIK